MNIIRYIRREIFKLTQQEFAAAIKVAQPTISRWETGVNDPSLHDLRRIRSEARKRKLPWDDGLIFREGGRAA